LHQTNIAIIGFEEGIAGQIDSWMNSIGYDVKLFIHPFDKAPEIQKIKRNVKLFDYPENNEFKGKPLILKKEWHDVLNADSINYCIVALSDPEERKKQIKYATENDIDLINAVHPSVVINSEVTLGVNVIIMSGAIIGYRSEVENGVFINTGVQIDHHCKLDKYSTLNPGCVLAGNVFVGEKAVIHTNATVINKMRIGKSSIVGAGCVVIKDVKVNDIVAGVPGRSIKRSREPLA